ncbi:MAG TPA: hypothetical protein VH497_17295 [Vicinamibacterales bacterium]
MTMERILRWTAIVIAILAILDPPITLAGRVRSRLGLVVQDGPSMGLPDGAARVRRGVAAQIVEAMKRNLGAEFEIVPGQGGDTLATIVVGDHYPDDQFVEGSRISTVTVSDDLRPNVRIAGVDAPARVPPGTAIRLALGVEAAGMTGSRSTIVVRAGGAEVGRSSHQWTKDPESWAAEIGIVPVGVPPFRFDVRVLSSSSERTDLDNVAEVEIEQTTRLRVFVFEARPSWTSAFVRRALERDPRFEVAGRSQVSPKASVASGDSSSSAGGGVDRFDAYDVVVVGGVDALPADVEHALEHFAGIRGGAVVLLPDTRAAATVVNRFLPGAIVTERLLERPAKLASTSPAPQLDASELLESDRLPRGAIALATNPGSGQPIIWSSELGDGRLLFSGAMDAWRFRSTSDEAFGRFWRSTVAGLAMEARPPIDVRLAPGRAAPGERVHVTARVRALEREQLGDRLAISARFGDEPIRLWPDAPRGAFRGSFVIDTNTTASSVPVTVAADEAVRGQARLTIDRSVREPAGPPLALLAAAHAGINVGPGQLRELERFLRGGVVDPQWERKIHYPMRSALWFIPFAACVSGEWWLRRRAGRR